MHVNKQTDTRYRQTDRGGDIKETSQLEEPPESVESKVQLRGYQLQLVCSHRSCCLEVLLGGGFLCTQSAVNIVWLERVSWGPSSLILLGQLKEAAWREREERERERGRERKRAS